MTLIVGDLPDVLFHYNPFVNNELALEWEIGLVPDTRVHLVVRSHLLVVQCHLLACSVVHIICEHVSIVARVD